MIMTFDDFRPLRFKETEDILAPERRGSKSFGTFEKRVPGPSEREGEMVTLINYVQKPFHVFC